MRYLLGFQSACMLFIKHVSSQQPVEDAMFLACSANKSNVVLSNYPEDAASILVRVWSDFVFVREIPDRMLVTTARLGVESRFPESSGVGILQGIIDSYDAFVYG
ncbi:MAG: hypothetical protein HC888_00625 [Candidatus Competibacteraceae bacterium]|nr:hypothetical protein [Candidatus Competibacteraceae bacterium]